ncbi:MAG: NAD(P)H:quinone oxidoreductase [Methanocalculus sp. MSAO_Arc1]|uniref:NAD(P)H:quinone oxidoreductase n=1 Tax=Methanocalculus TaxID=71151 RepID=UPI000FF55FAC|nr:MULTISPECIES: NAD(P)H:quinone oxidoreductase [unclassified Methanocalculus]MCP1661717.1 NAD(P)H dehydrogenase (quinone) [Methanocalculus sp. AMF5]RQD80767.1 MAG: NAD(P)H:quinone oxidoreductase [Methanocalculus sp. MSAO_Arc1]
MTTILIVYYSLFGHVHQLAGSVAEGVREGGAVPLLRRVPETLSQDVIEKMGAARFQAEFAEVPVCSREELADADAVIFGTPTRFGNMCGQMRQFLDATGGLWQRQALMGKVGSVFTSSGTQHGGQESTILATQITLLHHGMLIAGLPYGFRGQSGTDEVSGCSPYGASTIAGGGNERLPSANELAGARWQGTYVALLANRLADGYEKLRIDLGMELVGSKKR